jgi:mannose-6-phosphate isomerase-like protein (cupin superfamily)
MEVVKKNESTKKQNSAICTVLDYFMDDKQIGGAVVILGGRYPDKGYAVNHDTKEMAYVLDGKCTLITEKEKCELTKGDLVLIDTEEKYYWDGEARMFVVNTPRFNPDQHEWVE